MEKAEDHSLDTKALDSAWEYMKTHQGGWPILNHRDCLVVIKDGALVYETYSSEKYNTTAHQGYSTTKTLGALITGWAVTHKDLDIDADITKTFGVKSPRPYPVTSRQIMSQALAGEHGPGEAWAYDADGTEWISTLTKVIPAATGKKPSEIWKEQFHGPLGLSDTFTWDNADSHWAYGASSTCRDYARVGQLMLNKGHWKGVDSPIVSEDYIHQLSIPETRYGDYKNYSNNCYGLLTWLNTQVGEDDPKYPGQCFSPTGPGTPDGSFPNGAPKDVFFAAGMYGQIIMVLPTHNAVAVSMGHSNNQNVVPAQMYDGFCKAKVFEDCGTDHAIIV